MSEILKGQVDDVRILREGWGWVVLLHGSANERAKVIGHPLGVEVGDTVEAEGDWARHPKFGRQFKAREIRVTVPTDASGAVAWMMSRLPAVGRKHATEMVERWPIPELWEVLEHRHAELVSLRGITEQRAEAIHRAYMARLPERDRIVQLKGFGLTDRQIARIQDAFGADSLEQIRRDPYVLIEKVDGFGFVRADDLARRMGLPTEHPSRIQAGLLHLLREAEGAGHVYVPAGKLVSMATRLLSVAEPLVRRQANALLDADRLVCRGSAVYHPRLARAEEDVAASVLRLLGSGGEPANDEGGETEGGEVAA